MIKGVNRQVVEINNTGSEYFERILLIIHPAYIDEKEDRIKSEADRIVKSYLISSNPHTGQMKKRRFSSGLLMKLCLAAGAGALFAALILRLF